MAVYYSDDDRTQTSYEPPNLTLVSELLEQIEISPPAKEAHKILMQHYAACGWFPAAEDIANQILSIDSTDTVALCYVKDSKKRAIHDDGTNRKQRRARIPDPSGKGKAKVGNDANEQGTVWQQFVSPVAAPVSTLQDLEKGYVALLEDAGLLHDQMKLLKGLDETQAFDCGQLMIDIALLAKGKMSSVLTTRPVEGVKAVTRAVIAGNRNGSQDGLGIAIKDLEGLTRKLACTGDPKGNVSKAKAASNGDVVREGLVSRVKALKGSLPKHLHSLADAALMHVEHELLGRTYVNSETMLGDEVADIPRANFWVTEDGYAWDMKELAQAIKSNKGVMRNPLSKTIFTRADIGSIVKHPLGKELGALQMEQSKLKRGVRPKTIEALDQLAKVLIEDMTEDQMPSHLAVEVFVSYLATLPSGEQKAVEELKVPAKDSHTGVEFDTTIGEAVTDAQGNRVCIHKTGDFLTQAVRYLKGSK